MSSEADIQAASPSPQRPARPNRHATNAGAFDDAGAPGPKPAGPKAPHASAAPTQAPPAPAAGEPAVVVDNLGKCYHIYDRPEDRLKQALFRWRGRTYYRDFWALKDVSFRVMPGEAMGIVGRNGSGKSTLMQMIAGTLAPTTGSVTVRGRVAALLELGSGFNPDFTGRENVFLYGAILGLAKRDIEARFDEIAAMADIGQFLEQPIKTYSTGMRVRLAFAVQVQVRPEVLIIDEALSVGDNLFQKRCHERLRQLREAGTTLLFVSHQQEIIRTLTSRCLLLHGGRVRSLGEPAHVLLEYRRILHEEEKRWTTQRLAAARHNAPPEPQPGGSFLARQEAAEQEALEAKNRAAAAAPAQASAPIRGPTPAATDALVPAPPTTPPTPTAMAASPPDVGTASENAPPDGLPESPPARSYGDSDARITKVELLGADGEGCSLFYPGDRVLIRVGVTFQKPMTNACIALRLRDKFGVKIHSWGTLNQDIAAWSGLRPYDDPTGAGGDHEDGAPQPEAFWLRSFEPGQSVTVEFEWVCTLGAGFYEVQACITHERTPDYRSQRMVHWVDEAAFFEVKIARTEYFFGGMVDLRMRANVMD